MVYKSFQLLIGLKCASLLSWYSKNEARIALVSANITFCVCSFERLVVVKKMSAVPKVIYLEIFNEKYYPLGMQKTVETSKLLQRRILDVSNIA